MRKKIIILIIAIVMGISGCSSAKRVNSDASITKDHALEIVASDLRHHGVDFKQLVIHNIRVNQAGTKAVVECEIILPNGKTSDNISLTKENGRWHIDGHSH